MAFMQHSAPLKSTLIMASVGTLLAALLLHGIFAVPARWDYIMGWSLSGMFWAGCGALLVRLMKLIVAIRQ
ncbi:inner membrane protein YbjM [Pantoea stewartii]